MPIPVHAAPVGIVALTPVGRPEPPPLLFTLRRTARLVAAPVIATTIDLPPVVVAPAVAASGAFVAALLRLALRVAAPALVGVTILRGVVLPRQELVTEHTADLTEILRRR